MPWEDSVIEAAPLAPPFSRLCWDVRRSYVAVRLVRIDVVARWQHLKMLAKHFSFECWSPTQDFEQSP